jgi:hypothetical protein
MAWMISRIDASSPPGVSISSTTSWAPPARARSMLRRIKLALAGLTAPLSGIT